jgi:hypothetical protein
MTLRPFVALCATAALAAACLTAAAPAAAGLQVEFIAPERYADAHLGHFRGTDQRVLQVLEQHLQQWASRCLPSTAELHIRILDIDLAGQQDWAGARRPRIMRETTWPRISLAYSLHRSDDKVTEARQRVTDMNYLSHSASLRSDSMPLPYERLMLGNWFEQAFCRRGSGLQAWLARETDD